MMGDSKRPMLARVGIAVWHPARLAVFIAVALLTVSGCSGAPQAGNTVKPTNGVSGPIAGDVGGVLRTKVAPLTPAQGALWGAWVAPVNGQTSAQAVAGLETQMGRQLDIVHRYEAWDDTWPSATELTWAAGGRILFANISVRQMSGSHLSWTAVANGSQDATIDALAGRLKSFGQELYVSFDEEPENRYHADPTTYTLASFVAAYKHLHDRLATDGVTNVAWVWNVTGYSGDESIYPSLYPGDSYVDWVAWDPYNWYSCSVNTTNVWQSFDSVVQPFYDWVSAGKLSSGSATKPLMLAEYGSIEHNAVPTKGQWFTDEVSTLPNRPNLKAVVYFDENKDCNWPIATSAASTTGFATSGLSCYVYAAGPCNLTVTLSSVLPNSGPVTGGTSVKITGTNLTGATAVKFGTASATAFTVDSSTQITATTPPGTGTVDTTVTVAGAASATTSADKFTFKANCVSTALTSSQPSPQNVSTTVTLNATSTGCPDANPLYRFYLRSAAGIWSIVRDFTPSASYAWNTNTYTPGTYLTGVWVKDALSTQSHDAYAFGTVTLEVPYCASTNISSDVPSPKPKGTLVTFTATSVGCPNPLYQWWINQAGAWTVIPGHDFAHSSATFAWDTSALADGTYQIGVWAKQQNSRKSHDAYAFNTYTLAIVTNTTHCQAANVAASPASPQGVGSAVSLTTTAFGCGPVLYRWWVQNTLGVWSIVKDYSTTNTFSWATGSLPAGTYLLGVWVRQVGSTSSHEAYGYNTYTLTVPPAKQPCAAVNLTPDVSSPQMRGTTVTFSAAALGCSSPTYEFFVAPPSTGIFGVVKPYGTSSSYTWNTTGLTPGTYQIGVYARHAGATTSKEAFAIITFQLLAG